MDGELVEDKGEFLRFFVSAEIGADGFEFFGEDGAQFFVVAKFVVGHIFEMVFGAEFFDKFRGWVDEGHIVGLSGAEDDGNSDDGGIVDFLLECGGDDVFSVFEFVLFFDAPGDP